MLIQFSIANYKTFKDKVTWSMVPRLSDKTNLDTNVFETGVRDIKLLKSSVVYGANASGKTKLVEAFEFFRKIVLASATKYQKGDEIGVEPFLLSTETENAPSEFELIFIQEGVQYRYGMELDRSQVVAEWFYHKPNTKEVELFYRDYQEFDIHDKEFSQGKYLVKDKRVLPNVLLLSKAAQENEESSGRVIDWLRNFKIISGVKSEGYKAFTLKQAQDPALMSKIVNLLKAADLGIEDLEFERLDFDNVPNNFPKGLKELLENEKKEGSVFVMDEHTVRLKYDAEGSRAGSAKFSMREQESSGTNSFFALTGPILDCLENGYTLVIDELGATIHPNLVAKIVSLFNSTEFNPKNAQLLFNTHDTNLLSAKVFRRDQIWFTEKDRFGSAKLYSLAEIKGVRKEESLALNYQKGVYGGVPYLGLFNRYIHEVMEGSDEK